MAIKHSIKAARHGMVYVAGQSLGSIAVLATFAILARMLSITNWGLYSLVIAFYTFFGMLGNFAIGSAVRKKMVDLHTASAKSRLISSAYLLSFIISVIVALAGLAASGFAAHSIYHQASIVAPLMLVSVLIISWAIFNLTLSVLVMLDKVWHAAFIAIVYAFVQLVVAPLLVFLGFGLIGAIWGLAIGIVSATVLGLLYVHSSKMKLGFKPDKKEVKFILGFSTPVYISHLVMQGVYSLGILILGSVVSASIIGNYNIAYELGGFVSIILTTSMFILLPTFSRLAKKREQIGESLNKSIHYTLLFLAPMVAYVIASSKPLVFAIFSHKYIYAPALLAVVTVGLSLGIIWNYASMLMLGQGDTKRFLRYQIVSAFIELLLLFTLTPLFKITGMLVALFVISPIVLNLLYIQELRKNRSYKPAFGKAGTVVLAAAVSFAVMYIISNALSNTYITLITSLIITIAVYPPIVAFFGGLTRADIAFLRKAFGRRAIAKPLIAITNYASLFSK